MEGRGRISTVHDTSLAVRRQNADSCDFAGVRYGGIDAMRHLLSIGVIIQHTWSASRYPAEMRPAYESLTTVLGGTVFGFFLISGFFLKRRDDLRTYSISRAVRIIVPYLLFSAIYGLAAILLHGAPAIPLLVDTFILHGTSMQLYFLPYLFIIDISAVALFSRVISPNPRVILALAAVAVLAILALPTPNTTGSGLRLAIFYIFGLLAGMLIARVSVRQALALSAAALILGIAVDERLVIAGMTMSVFLLFLHISDLFPPTLPGSGAVYLLHTPVLNFALSTVLLAAGVGDWLNLTLTVVLTYVVCIGLAAAVFMFLPKRRFLILE